MKIYTSKFDIAQLNEQKFWAPQHSDIGIGVKLTKSGEDIDNAFTVTAGGVALSAEADKIDGYTIFKTATAGEGSVEYTISAANVAEPMKLVQIVTDSTVFDKTPAGSGGGSSYTLPTASETTLGGVKIPDSGYIYIDDGVIDANVTNIGNSMFSKEGNGIVFDEYWSSFGLDWENGQEWTFTMADGTTKTFQVIAQDRTQS